MKKMIVFRNIRQFLIKDLALQLNKASGWVNLHKGRNPPPIAPPSPYELQGKICLRKGDKPIIIEKTPSIIATVSWRSGTDYDIYALIITKSGKEFAVATFGTDRVPVCMDFRNGIVHHRGDVVGGKKGTSIEVIDIIPDNDIVAVVPVAYSAQSNGTGSFFRYKVSLSIDNNKGTVVTIPAENANNNDKVYTCVPGIIYNKENGLEIRALEMYSMANSENRPKLTLNPDNTVSIIMDIGPKNNYK